MHCTSNFRRNSFSVISAYDRIKWGFICHSLMVLKFSFYLKTISILNKTKEGKLRHKLFAEGGKHTEISSMTLVVLHLGTCST